MNCNWSTHWLHHNTRSLLPTPARSINLPLELDNEQSCLCHFYSYNAVENEAHFVLGYPLYNPITNKFPSLFEYVVPGSLKSFFQCDQQVNISLYLAEVATVVCHSRELAGLKPCWCTFRPTSLFIFPDFRINFVSLRCIACHSPEWHDGKAFPHSSIMLTAHKCVK